MKTILVPLDGSPASVHAATIAAGLAPLWGADLDRMGIHGLEGFARFAFGSVAMSVVHKAPCPVLVVGPAARHGAGEPSTGD